VEMGPFIALRSELYWRSIGSLRSRPGAGFQWLCRAAIEAHDRMRPRKWFSSSEDCNHLQPANLNEAMRVFQIFDPCWL
jgi:hypothetical protein